MYVLNEKDKEKVTSSNCSVSLDFSPWSHDFCLYQFQESVRTDPSLATHGKLSCFYKHQNCIIQNDCERWSSLQKKLIQFTLHTLIIDAVTTTSGSLVICKMLCLLAQCIPWNYNVILPHKPHKTFPSLDRSYITNFSH